MLQSHRASRSMLKQGPRPHAHAVCTEPAGDAPIKAQHSSGREIGVNIEYIGNLLGIKYKLNGFELGGCHLSQIR